MSYAGSSLAHIHGALQLTGRDGVDPFARYALDEALGVAVDLWRLSSDTGVNTLVLLSPGGMCLGLGRNQILEWPFAEAITTRVR